MSREFVDIHTHSTPCRVLTLSSHGVHPWCVDKVTLPLDVTPFEGVEAVGEIGLDFHSTQDRVVQQQLFEAQLQIAEALSKIVVIHCVKAYGEVLATLKKYTLRVVVFHGFVGSVELMERIIAQGYYVSYGHRTLRSPKTCEALRRTPLNRLFLESDDSGQSIESIYKLSSTVLNISVEVLREAIYCNYYDIVT